MNCNISNVFIKMNMIMNINSDDHINPPAPSGQTAVRWKGLKSSSLQLSKGPSNPQVPKYSPQRVKTKTWNRLIIVPPVAPGFRSD